MSDEDPFDELDEAVEDREGDPFDDLGYPDEEGSDDSAESAPPNRDEADDATDWLASAEPADHSGEQDDPVEGTDPSDDPVERTDPADSERGPGDHSPGDTSEMEFGIGRREREGKPDAPSLGDLGSREGDPFESVQGAFEQMDTGEMDPDAVWQNLASAESRGSVGDARKRTYAAVSKHSYCEQCEHFSDPPEIRCTHEGTEIIEFLDMETVRVVDCPIVAEREQLEES